MLNRLPAPLVGLIAALLLALNTLFWCVLLYIPALLKLIPIRPWQLFCTHVIIYIAETWVACNSGWMRLTQRTQWQVEGLEGLSHEGWYLVLCNHQSWVDIFALQHVLNRRVPFLKFFLKKELIWVPVIGLAWWGLDFPFMKRYSLEYLAKHPEKRGKDMETTRRACAKFRTRPVSIMNFVEGTRFTQAKHDKQRSTYQYLLKPKAGGIAFVLDAMGDSISQLLDVTIAYPEGRPTLWQFLCGRVPRVVMQVEKRVIPEELRQPLSGGAQNRGQVKQWLAELWAEKDAKLARMQPGA